MATYKPSIFKYLVMNNIKIKSISDHEIYEVNDKEVYKDSNGNWIARGELSWKEWNAFNNYKKTVIENPAFKFHTKATYKT